MPSISASAPSTFFISSMIGMLPPSRTSTGLAPEGFLQGLLRGEAEFGVGIADISPAAVLPLEFHGHPSGRMRFHVLFQQGFDPFRSCPGTAAVILAKARLGMIVLLPSPW